MTNTYANFVPMAKFGGGSLDAQFRRFKKRLKWLLQTTADTQAGIVDVMSSRHAGISTATVSRWMDEESDAAPDQRELMALMMSHPDTSVDWLLGRTPAKTLEEQFIEKKIGGKV